MKGRPRHLHESICSKRRVSNSHGLAWDEYMRMIRGRATHYDSPGTSPSSADLVADIAEVGPPRTPRRALHSHLCLHPGHPTDLFHHVHALGTQGRYSAEDLSDIRARPGGCLTRAFED